MSSVSARARAYKQPRGGYLKPSSFETIDLNDGKTLNTEENIGASIVGTVVDYMTRFLLGASKGEAFQIPLQGVLIADKFVDKDYITAATKLMNGIKGLDKKSIICACKMVSFDVWRRNLVGAVMSRDYTDINPDEATIQNIQILVRRSMAFFKQYGKVIQYGFTFEPPEENQKAYEQMIASGKGTYGGYTATVESGDGDFLTENTLWDFKVFKAKPTCKHTLQLLMYWIMGQHSGQEIYKHITKIGMFNPRLNQVYILDMNTVPNETIRIVEDEVICYE